RSGVAPRYWRPLLSDSTSRVRRFARRARVTRRRPASTRSRRGRIVSSWLLWLIVGIGLLVSEMVAPGFWLINVAAGCFASAAVALVVPWLGLGLQTATFAAVTLASAVLIRPILLRHFHRGDVRTNVDSLIGKTAVVIQR